MAPELPASLKNPPKAFFQILVVDDENLIQQLILHMLQGAGYTAVKTVGSGEAAILDLMKKEYHLILLDKNLPGIDGLGVLKEAKKLWPGIEVIMMTGYASMESAVEAMHLGAYSYITKPFNDINKIIDRVKGATERIIVRHRGTVLINRLESILADMKGIESETDRAALSRRALEAADQIRRVSLELKQL